MLRQDPAERPASLEAVKNEIIARGRTFVEKQHLDRLKSAVVPVTEVDDPLITDPPHLVDAHWDAGSLTLKLSRTVNQQWVWALQHMGTYHAVSGKDPVAFAVSGDPATIGAQPTQVQEIVNAFKSWLPVVNRLYADRAAGQLRQAADSETKRLQAAISAAELQEQVNRSISI